MIADLSRMDITRKFIQMGRTRSLRYALRKGGRKYEEPLGDKKGKRKRGDDNEGENQDEGKDEERADKKEIPRTGQVYDQGKLDGANIFEGYLDRCWADEVYARAWEDWRKASKEKPTKAT